MSRARRLAPAGILILVPSAYALPADGVLTQFNDNGAWSWFQDERAIIQLRDALLKAYDAGDGKTLSEIEDDAFTLAGEFGQMTKQQHLDQVRGRDAADRGGSRDRRRRQG